MFNLAANIPIFSLQPIHQLGDVVDFDFFCDTFFKPHVAFIGACACW